MHSLIWHTVLSEMIEQRKKKNDSKNTVKLQVSILNFELYFIFLKTAFDCSLKLAKKPQNLIV